jgi:Zn-dependent protease
MDPTFEVLPPRRPPQPPPSKRGPTGGLLAILAAVGAGAFKFAAPLLILLKTGGTMLLSIGAYAYMFKWGWGTATGVVFLVLVHEMGHVFSAKYYRIPVTAPMFIPFVGAYVLLKSRPLDAWTNAIISYAGPLAGGLGGWAALLLEPILGWPSLLTVAFYTFLLNLFNLLPIPPLDGSHIWICFSRAWTPNMTSSDRFYLGLYLASLIAGLLLGMLKVHEYSAM